MPLKIFNGPIIRAGQFQSDVLSITDYFIVGLGTPDGWTPAMASLIVSPDGDRYYDLYDGSGREFVFNVVLPGTMIRVNSHLLMSAAFIRLRSGTRDYPITQQSQRTFTLVGASKLAMADEMEATK